MLRRLENISTAPPKQFIKSSVAQVESDGTMNIGGVLSESVELCCLQKEDKKR